MLSSSKVSDALELAIASLAEVAANGSESGRIDAARVLLETYKSYESIVRKQALYSEIEPLLQVLVQNLSGTLPESATFSPAMTLTPAEAGTIVLQLTQKLAN